MALTQSTIAIGTKGGSDVTAYPAIYNDNINTLLAWSASVPDNFQLASLQDDDVLVYDLGLGKWVNQTKVDADLASKATADAHYAKTVDETSSDTTKDKHISNALTKSYSDHLVATTAHGATGAVVGTTNTQTLTNKTLTSPVISTIINTGTLTLPTSTDTLIGRDTTDTLTNKSLVDSTTFLIDNLDNTKKAQFQLSGITSGQTRTLTVQDKSYTLADHANLTSGYILGKTLDATNIGDGRVIKYDLASDKLVYSDITIGVGTTINGGTASTPVTTIQVRRDTSANFTSNNPVLSAGEIGLETNSNLMKFGNGVTAWTSLPYFSAGSVPSGEINTMSSVGGYTSLFYQKSGVDLQIKSIQAGANMVVTDNGTYLTLSASSTLSYLDGTFVIQNTADNTKQIAFSASGITTSTTRTITMPDRNVTLDTFNGSSIFTQVSTPSNPSAGSNKLYFKNDDKLYKLTSGGTETEVGGGTYIIQSKTTTYTALITDDLIFCDGTFTVDLPTASTWTKPITIKNIGTGTITVDANSTETIDGELTIDLLQYDSLTLMSNGTNIYII